MKTKRVTRYFFTLSLTFILSACLSAEEKKPMNFVDVINLKSVSNLSLSPDGTQLLFTVAKADWEENKTISHIYRINRDGTGMVQMTNGKDGERGGQWSPDCRTIAFLAKRDLKERQIHILNNSGGEAVPFTDHKGEIQSFQWSPDGTKIYFTAEDPKTKQEKKKDKIKDDAFLFEKDWKYEHLWVIDVETGEETRLTEGDFTVRSFNISRDGSTIVFSKAPTPLFDDVLKAEIAVLVLKDKKIEEITDNTVYETNLRFSPDNKRILFVADADEKLQDHYYQSDLFVMPADGGMPERMLPDFTPEVFQAEWSSDGNTIYFTANMGVHVEIFSVSAATKEIRQLTDGMHSIYDFDYVHRIDAMAYQINSPHNPGTFWTADMKSFAPTLVLDPYTEDLKNFKLAKFEPVRWASVDGHEVEGILIYPLDYKKGKRYPLLAHTHGGPASSDKMRFDGYAHARAGRGYAILKPNYRGSTGYGNEVLRDMVGHYFLHAQHDVLTGVDFLIGQGITDPEKLGTLGWSAGGHMTNWLITETDRFKAASSGAGASNWISMYSQSDVRIYRTPWFLGDPWHEDSPLDTYREHSAIFRIHKAVTPTLILVGENDKRVPMPQSVELYRGLKANHVPTDLVVFPRSGHGPRELHHRLYKMNKEFHWLEKYIMGREFQFDNPPEKEKEEKEGEEE